ncbi:MAG TPA: amidohydrolase family protein, partial [Acidimicrobiia bacterium]|nr:amidohydrolase family protein [Acidimicrobiia bacterium]
GASVVITPSSEMAGGMGTPPLQRLIDHGIRPGLGVGTELFGAPTDLFAQMRAAISVQHATYFDLKLAGKAGLPKLLTTRQVIRWATVDGARAVGLDVGTLEPGMPGDVIVLRADVPNIHPVNDPIGAVVWGMDTSNVAWVLVGGEIVKRDGVLVADVEGARRGALDAHRRVAAAAGLVSAGGTR